MIAAGVAIPAAFLMPNIPIALRPLVKLFKQVSCKKKTENFTNSITYLKTKRLVSIAEKDGQQILTLSEVGKTRVAIQFVPRNCQAQGGIGIGGL
jgi:hypothetical protein